MQPIVAGHHINVGAIFRSAAALGVDAVLITPRCAVPLYRRAIRVSMGTVFQVPWTRLPEGRGGPWAAGRDVFRDAGIHLAALALADGAVPLDEFAAARPERVALVLGTEGEGLPANILSSFRTARIPQRPGLDSLNVATASGIALYQIALAMGRIG